MERLVSLMTEKNHYLEKFYSLNETELEKFRLGNFETLDYFYQSRERILEIIKYIDGQFAESQETHADVQMPEHIKKQCREAMLIKDQYVQKIIEQDLEVLSCIEEARNIIIKELQDLKRAKKAVSGYRQPTFGNRVDEEA